MALDPQVPWSLINGELVAILQDPETALDWVNLLFTAVLGGVRFFSQLLVLKVSTATTLSCANLAFQAINIYLSLALFGKPTLTVGCRFPPAAAAAPPACRVDARAAGVAGRPVSCAAR